MSTISVNASCEQFSPVNFNSELSLEPKSDISIGYKLKIIDKNC